jgi:NADPH:quinone reductase-like Zn-dependent oxidoreductase
MGDRVWGYHYANPKGGFYAEYIAMDATHVGMVPKHLDLVQAGAGATTGLTALQGVEDVLHLRSGDTVLIYGSSGAVGTLALQFAKRLGARVIATASGARGAALVRGLGADELFDARSRNAPSKLRKVAPDGFDAALVLASGESLESCLSLIRRRGRIAYPNGVEPEPKRRQGISMVAYDAVAGPEEFARLERAATEARLRVSIAAVYPLAQAAKAHARLERGHILGRIALRIRRAGK